MADVRARKRACRVMRNLTVSPVTEGRLTAMAARTGISRGRIVDLAVANLEVCPACDGIPEGPDGLSPPCKACAAIGLVPGSAL